LAVTRLAGNGAREGIAGDVCAESWERCERRILVICNDEAPAVTNVSDRIAGNRNVGRPPACCQTAEPDIDADTLSASRAKGADFVDRVTANCLVGGRNHALIADVDAAAVK